MYPTGETEYPVNYLGPMQPPTVHDPYACIGLFQPSYNNSSSRSNNNYYGSMNNNSNGYGGNGYNNGGGYQRMNRRNHHEHFFEPPTVDHNNNNSRFYHHSNPYSQSSSPDWEKWSNINGSQYSMNPNNIRMSTGMSDLISSYF